MDLLRPIVEEMNLLEDQWKEQETMISQLNSEITCYSEARERELPLVQEEMPPMIRRVMGLHVQRC